MLLSRSSSPFRPGKPMKLTDFYSRKLPPIGDVLREGEVHSPPGMVSSSSVSFLHDHETKPIDDHSRGEVQWPPSMDSSSCVSYPHDLDNHPNEVARDVSSAEGVAVHCFFSLTPDQSTIEISNSPQETVPIQPKRKHMASSTNFETLVVNKKAKWNRIQKEKDFPNYDTEEDKRNGVSTELVLGFDPYKIKKKIEISNSPQEAVLIQPKRKYMASPTNPETLVVDKKAKWNRIQKEKVFPKYDMEEDKRNGVSTELVLGFDPYMIKKKLTQSDLGHLSRLLIGRDIVRSHVLQWMSEDTKKQVESSKGAEVVVKDDDTCSEHRLVLALWTSSGSYVLKGGWNKEFVKRRGLAVEDEVGIYWEPFVRKFHFKLLHKAS